MNRHQFFFLTLICASAIALALKPGQCDPAVSSPPNLNVTPPDADASTLAPIVIIPDSALKISEDTSPDVDTSHDSELFEAPHQSRALADPFGPDSGSPLRVNSKSQK
jgi:hypothetical protein